MKISINYQEVLEESLKEDLIWLIEEFNLLFSSKLNKLSMKDKEIANAIMDYIMEHTYVHDNIILYNLFFEALENIEKLYPNLF
ncbi:MAG: hypothetical protein ACFFEY_02440 [Candidatus Thorarchaeota archaeon]